MNGPDHVIEPVENLSVVIDPSVGEDVGLDTLQDPKVAEVRVEAIDLVVLSSDPVSLQSAGVERGFRVVGYTDVAPAPIPRRLCHVRDGCRAVGIFGMAVQDATQIVVHYQLGKFSRRRCFHLTHVFPHLGWDPGKVEDREQRFFVGERDRPRFSD
jgi:hypothetical protein